MNMPANFPPPFVPGQRVRVTADEPYSSELILGDIVTVADLAIKVEPNGDEILVVIVNTAYGERLLGLDVIEPLPDVTLEPIPMDYTPAEPDDVVDEFFFRILGNDDELRDWAVKARTELAANDSTEGQVGLLPTDHEHASKVGDYDVGPEDFVSITDFDGDEMNVVYTEHECDEHGREGALVFEIEGVEVLIPTKHMRGLVGWFISRIKHSERTDSPEDEA